MLRVGRPDARFLIMVPNLDHPEFEGTDQQKIKETLLSFKDWKDLLNKGGLKILNTYPDRWPVNWIPLPKKNPIRFLIGLYKRYKFWTLPVEKSYQLMFVAKKKWTAAFVVIPNLR